MCPNDHMSQERHREAAGKELDRDPADPCFHIFTVTNYRYKLEFMSHL